MHNFININSNRLTHVFTSRDGLIWEKEAKYWYYKHGPLARTEIGDLDVQGMDYAYTLQGWVKGINSNILEAANDLGRDNYNDAENIHKNFGEDAASYSIGYFSGDFVAINPNYANFVAGIGSAGLATEAPDLYNGNINHMVTTIRNDAYAAQPQLTAYRYDQLNRIKQMRVQNAISNNSWAGSWVDRYKTLYDYDANGNIMSLTRYGGISPIEIIDQMHYQYSSNNNQLEYITDQYPLIETPTTEPNFSGQSSGNYKYDLIGNMTEDVSGKIKEIKWNVYGKIESISRPDGNTTDDCLYFEYDATGNRVYKKSWRKDASNNDVQIKHTFYVRDAQGNILATYTKDGSNEIKLGEYNLYGSSRLGTASYNTTMSNLSWQNSGIYSRTLGLKRYEISNHLGNVLTVFSDKKHTLSNTNRTTPYIVSTTDYDPFGMIMNGRNWNAGEYRFAFNGQEKDQEIYNNESTTTAMFWEYDGRIGRRWNLDPKPDASLSNYSCFENNPISYNDPLGDIPWKQLVLGFKGHANPPTLKRVHPTSGKIKPHHGMDMSAKTGTSVKSAAGGTVIQVTQVSGYGTVVVVNHGNGIITLYAHLSSTDVKKGEKVTNGQNLGGVGMTGGISSGPHLHVEYIKMKSIKETYSINELLINKAENRFNPKDVKDLDNVVNGNEKAEITFLNGNTTTIGNVKESGTTENTEQAKYNGNDMNQAVLTQSKFSNRFIGNRSAIVDLVGRGLKKLGF